MGDGDINFGGLSYSSAQGKWTAGGSDIADGSFYVEGDFTTTGCPPGWATTIVAEGCINFGGNADVVNFKDPSDTADIQDMFLYVGLMSSFPVIPQTLFRGI